MLAWASFIGVVLLLVIAIIIAVSLDRQEDVRRENNVLRYRLMDQFEKQESEPEDQTCNNCMYGQTEWKLTIIVKKQKKMVPIYRCLLANKEMDDNSPCNKWKSEKEYLAQFNQPGRIIFPSLIKGDYDDVSQKQVW